MRRPASELHARTRFDPAAVEPALIEAVARERAVAPEPAGDAAENYSIAIPPPNVTGALHMGHALNGSIQDALVRRRRMRGQRTKWIFGTDHASIATQTQVEQALRAEGTSPRGARPRGVRRARLGVARAVRRHDHRAVQAPRRVLRLRRRALHARRGLRRRGADACSSRSTSAATSTATTTWSTGTRAAARRSPTSRSRSARSPTRCTAIAYPLADGSGELVVATVRPETMLADTAVAVHPDDERYRTSSARGDPAARRARAADHRRRATSSPTSAPAR